MMTARKIKVVVLLAFALSVCAGSTGAQQGSMREVGARDWSAQLPDGEGKGLILATCTPCHSLNSTVLQRKEPDEWKETVKDMVARGAQLRLTEIEEVSAYLARHFGPDAEPFAATAARATPSRPRSESEARASLPDGPAKVLMLRSCTGCHGIKTITDQRKDPAGWENSVSDMVKLGAQLEADEMNTLAAYLAKHLDLREQESTNGRMDAAPGIQPETLPDGEGKLLILATCVQCHNLNYVTRLRKSAEDWKETVHDMVARGAQLTTNEIEIMVRYLADNLAQR